MGGRERKITQLSDAKKEEEEERKKECAPAGLLLYVASEIWKNEWSSMEQFMHACQKKKRSLLGLS